MDASDTSLLAYKRQQIAETRALNMSLLTYDREQIAEMLRALPGQPLALPEMPAVITSDDRSVYLANLRGLLRFLKHVNEACKKQGAMQACTKVLKQRNTIKQVHDSYSELLTLVESEKRARDAKRKEDRTERASGIEGILSRDSKQVDPSSTQATSKPTPADGIESKTETVNPVNPRPQLGPAKPRQFRFRHASDSYNAIRRPVSSRNSFARRHVSEPIFSYPAPKSLYQYQTPIDNNNAQPVLNVSESFSCNSSAEARAGPEHTKTEDAPAEEGTVENELLEVQSIESQPIEAKPVEQHRAVAQNSISEDLTPHETLDGNLFHAFVSTKPATETPLTQSPAEPSVQEPADEALSHIFLPQEREDITRSPVDPTSLHQSPTGNLDHVFVWQKIQESVKERGGRGVFEDPSGNLSHVFVWEKTQVEDSSEETLEELASKEVPSRSLTHIFDLEDRQIEDATEGPIEVAAPTGSPRGNLGHCFGHENCETQRLLENPVEEAVVAEPPAASPNHISVCQKSIENSFDEPIETLPQHESPNGNLSHVFVWQKSDQDTADHIIEDIAVPEESASGNLNHVFVWQNLNEDSLEEPVQTTITDKGPSGNLAHIFVWENIAHEVSDQPVKDHYVEELSAIEFPSSGRLVEGLSDESAEEHRVKDGIDEVDFNKTLEEDGSEETVEIVDHVLIEKGSVDECVIANDSICDESTAEEPKADTPTVKVTRLAHASLLVEDDSFDDAPVPDPFVSEESKCESNLPKADRVISNNGNTSILALDETNTQWSNPKFLAQDVNENDALLHDDNMLNRTTEVVDLASTNDSSPETTNNQDNMRIDDDDSVRNIENGHISLEMSVNADGGLMDGTNDSLVGNDPDGDLEWVESLGRKVGPKVCDAEASQDLSPQLAIIPPASDMGSLVVDVSSNASDIDVPNSKHETYTPPKWSPTPILLGAAISTIVVSAVCPALPSALCVIGIYYAKRKLRE